MVDRAGINSGSGLAGAFFNHSWARVAALFALLTCAGLGLLSWSLLRSTLLDSLSALMIVVPPLLLGYGLVSLIPLGTIAARWRFALAAGLGLAATSLLVLTLGLLGWLARPLWLTLLPLFTLFGLHAIRRIPAMTPSSMQLPRQRLHYLWLLFVPFAVLALRNASNPPGFLWAEEGFGYDILEYHLQLPKEYLQLGRISYLPHNVYANFPSNVEMLYLLSMIVHGGGSDLGTVANTIHLFLGVLFVVVLWIIGREESPEAGMVAAFAGGTVGWLSYLSGLAYVENGMLFFGALSLAAMQRAYASSDPPEAPRLWIALSGLFAGCSCGCKYPAVALIAIPLLLIIPILAHGAWTLRLRQAALYGVTCTAAFSPWLLKNLLTTGNPTFPLANSVFHAAPPGWGSEEDLRWERGHSPSAEQSGAGSRIRSLWSRTMGDPMQRFGPVVWVVPLALLLRRPWDRRKSALGVLLGIQLGVWMFATHLYSRFALPVLLPLCALLPLFYQGLSAPAGRMMVAACVALGAAWNFAFAAKLSRDEAFDAPPAALFSDGMMKGFEYLGVVNQQLPPTAKLLLVGDAKPYYFDRPVDYCVVFNRNPLGDSIRLSRTPGEVIHWLRGKGYTHVMVNWAEIARLRLTYGFDPEVTPQWFHQMKTGGLKLFRSWAITQDATHVIELWEVPGAATAP